MAKAKNNLLGGWAFLVGVILALVIGLGIAGSLTDMWIYVLLVLGLLVGLLNINDEETQPFLMSGLSLIIASALGQSVVSGVPYFSGILQAMLVLFVPATIVVAIKNVFNLARR